MTRSLWKGPFSEIPIKKKNLNKKIKIWSRRSIVLPMLVGQEFLIYNGKKFIPLKVSEDMVGHKFGEFSSTRKKPIHKKKRKN
jgi:small subunit ribosomal protein S19